VKKVEEAGADAFLSKPFRESELLSIAGRLLGLRFVEEEAVLPAPRPASRDAVTLDLPDEVREALREALRSADLDRVLQIAAELEPASLSAAGIIRDLAERFEYDRLLALLAPAGPGRSSPPEA